MRMLPPQVELDPFLLMLTMWLLVAAFVICGLREHGLPKFSVNKHSVTKHRASKRVTHKHGR
jgi:hypothetical protein